MDLRSSDRKRQNHLLKIFTATAPPDPKKTIKFEETTRSEVEKFAREYSGTSSVGPSPWNKSKKGVQEAWNKGMKMSPEFCEKARLVQLGKDKGLSYEERYGPEKAQEMRKIRSEKMKQTRASQPEKFIPWNKK